MKNNKSQYPDAEFKDYLNQLANQMELTLAET